MTRTAYISGELPHGKMLRPIEVRAVTDNGQIVISEPLYHMHGYGPTLAEAEADFRSVLVDEMESLEEDEGNLAPQLQDQLRYLRSIIAK